MPSNAIYLASLIRLNDILSTEYCSDNFKLAANEVQTERLDREVFLVGRYSYLEQRV